MNASIYDPQVEFMEIGVRSQGKDDMGRTVRARVARLSAYDNESLGTDRDGLKNRRNR
jgi:hypothetical protein